MSDLAQYGEIESVDSPLVTFTMAPVTARITRSPKFVALRQAGISPEIADRDHARTHIVARITQLMRPDWTANAHARQRRMAMVDDAACQELPAAVCYHQ